MVDSPTPKPTPPNKPTRPGAASCGSVNPALAGLASQFPVALSSFSNDPGQRFGVAYSGGADSTALLYAAAARWPGAVEAIHIHHGLQASAEAFVDVCTATCEALNVPLHVLRVDARHASGGSPEDSARRARYTALAKAAHTHQLAGVLLGQHADDQVETVLLALSRGAGLPGLSAMGAEFERHGVRFYRPLLRTAAASLREWLVESQIAFVDDPSNVDERYTRNRIRAQLMPALAAAFPQFRDTFARSAQHAAQAQTLLDEVAAQDLLAVGSPPVIRHLQVLTPARQSNVLRHWLKLQQAAPSAAQLAELLSQVTACTTRGHRIELKIAAGRVTRRAGQLHYQTV